MSCCGEARTTAMTPRHRLRVHYGGGRPVAVTGPATGASYRFSGTERVQLVEPRDAAALLRNPLFRAVGVVELSATELPGAPG